MGKLLIQANNLDTVIDVFMYIYLHPGCKKQAIADFCGFSLRQVDYYSNACKYLDLIENDWTPTELAKDIFKNNPTEVTERVYQRIIEDDIIGKIYKQICDNPIFYPSEYAKELVKINFPGYSEAVYERRSDNMIKWSIKIFKYLNNK